jgi:hypothetical protein
MSILALLGIVLIVLAIAGLVIGTSQRRVRSRLPQQPRQRGSTTSAAAPRKSRLTLVSEWAGIVGFVITIIGLLVR